jgi:hypothetical protein
VLGLPDVEILTGLAVGYEDPTHKINTVRSNRDHHKNNVNFVEE